MVILLNDAKGPMDQSQGVRDGATSMPKYRNDNEPLIDALDLFYIIPFVSGNGFPQVFMILRRYTSNI